MHVGCDVVCFTMIISDNGIGSEGAKALAPLMGQFNQLAELNLTGEWYGE